MAGRQAKGKGVQVGEPPTHLYMIGGRGIEGEPMSSVEVWDTRPIVQEWHPLPPLPEARWSASAASWGGKIYIFGGNCDGGSANTHIVNTVLVFDPQDHTWTPLPHMAVRRANACAMSVGKRIYVCGGFGGEHGTDAPLDLCERFDPALAEWEVLPKMSAKRFNAAVTCMGPLLFIFGGGTDKPDPLKSVERFDAREGGCTWESLPDMKTRRGGLTAAILLGMPHVFGGHDGLAVLSSAEKLSPVGKPWLEGGRDGEWKPSPDMLMPRYCASAVWALHPDRKPKVFILGGHNGLERVRDIECFSAETELWEHVPKNPNAEGRRMEVRAGSALGALLPSDVDKHKHHLEH